MGSDIAGSSDRASGSPPATGGFRGFSRRVVVRSALPVGLTAVATAACGAPSAGNAPSGDTSPGTSTPVRLQFAFYADPEQIQLFKDVGALLPKEDARVEVESLPFTPDEYMTKIGTQLAAGTAPDVMIMTDKEHPAQAVQGAFLDLAPFVQRTRTIPKREFFASEWSKYVVDGVVRGLPVISTQGVLWYHEGVFRDRGLALPPADWNDAKWTWPAFLDMTLKLTSGSGTGKVFGYDGQQNWWYAQPWVWSNGGNILNADNTASAFDRPEAQEGFQWMVDLVQRHKVMPTAADLKDGGTRRPMFYAGRLGTLMDVTAFATVMDAYPDVPWNVASLPRGKTGAITRSPGVGITVWAQTRHQTEAWRLMETVSGPPGAQLFARSHRGVPGYRKAAFSNDWVTPGSRIHWRVFPDALDGHSRAEQVTITFPDINRLIQQEWAKTLEGGQSVSQMVAILKPQVDALLQSGKRIRIGD